MQSLSKIRKATTKPFITIAAGSTLILLICIGWLSMRVDAVSFSHIVLIIGAAIFANIGLVAWTANRFNASMRER